MSELFERLSSLSPKRLALLALELQEKLDATSATAEPIAIVGMACRLPGAENPEAYWELLRDGRHAVTEVPRSRWDADALYDPDPDTPGKIATRWGGFLDGVDRFDPQLFGIAAREAQSLDPQQRLLLEVAWEALEHAGIAPDSLQGSATGVYVGLCNSDYGQILLAGDDHNFDLYLSTGNAGSVASGRLSYVFGLQGPALTVDTSCSSSLVAVHLAVQGLRSTACRMALAGGVNVILSPKTTMMMSRAKMMAADGRCKAFDARADGFVRGEGCGLVVLKRLSDAVADGDTVLAVIRGSAVNQDGRSNGLTAPNGPSQVAVIRAALADAEVSPGDIGYVETHGTGTSLGDPIEISALGVALGQGRPPEQRLMVGTAKANLGHLESAAGIAGVIKVVLSMQHAEVPPLLHLTEPNPNIAWHEIPIDVPVQRMAWPAVNGTRLAGVSSFGFSGTNAHVVLESAPPRDEAAAGMDDRVDELDGPSLHVLTLSARGDRALAELAERFANHIAAHPDQRLADIGFTANTGRSALPTRLAVVASDAAEAGRALASFAAGEHNPGLIAGGVAGNRPPPVAFLFTGHGSHYPDMGRGLYRTQSVFRDSIDRCAALLVPLMDEPLLDVMFDDDKNPRADALLDSMTYAQPAIFALEYALAELWRSWGVRPTAVAGHSAGEYVAAVVAGVMSLDDGLTLIAARGRLMASLPADGEMATVFASEERVREAIAGVDGVSIAAVNGPQSIALSGIGGALVSVVAELRGEGVEVRPLSIPIAAHSPQVDPILDEFERVAASVRFSAPSLDLVSGMTGALAKGDDLITANYWRRHLRRPVRFADAFRTIHAQGVRAFVEVGPHPTLLNMGRHVVPEHECQWLPSLRSGHDDRGQVFKSAAALWVRGVGVDWAGFDAPHRRCKVALPTYPFQRERHWIDPPRPHASRHVGAHPLLGTRLLSPAFDDIIFETELGTTWPGFLDHHRVFGAALLPSPAYLEMALAAAAAVFGPHQFAVLDFGIREALVLPDDGERVVQLLMRGDCANATFEVCSRAPTDTTWTIHAHGRIALAPTLAKPDEGAFDLAAVGSRCPEHIDGDAYYRDLDDAGLESGSSFRGVTEVWRREGEAIGRIALPEVLADEADRCVIDPALLHACFDVVGAPLPLAGEESAYLLTGIDSFRLHRRPGPVLWGHTVLRPGFELSAVTFVGDVRVYNDSGQVVAEVLGVHLKRVGREALPGTTAQSAPDWLYEVQWQPQSRPTDASINVARPWLVLGDGGGLGAQLAARVGDVGGHAMHLTETSGMSADDLQRVVDDMSAATSPVVVVAGTGRGVETILDAVLDTVQALIAAARPAALWIVTRGAQPADSAVTAPEQALLWGLGRVIAVEHPELWGGLIDLAADGVPAVDAAAVLSEIESAGDEDQIALRGDARLVARLTRRVGRQATPVEFHANASYLITGGLGGLGLKLAEWMAAHGARSIVLVGRTGMPVRATWDALADDSREAAQAAAIAAVEAHGATVTIVAADVADETAMTTLFHRFATDELPPLRGVIHAAAAVTNAPMSELSHDSLHAMLRPKVAGTLLLHELSRGLPLDFFVLFSSTAALWGSRHLGHYAAANAFLDAFAHQRHAMGLSALTINWGVWDEMRVASAAERDIVVSAGMHPMPSEGALGVLGGLLGDPDLNQITVASVDWKVLKPVYEARRTRPFLALMMSPRSAMARRSNGGPELRRALAGTAPVGRHGVIVAFLRDEVARALGIQPAGAIDLEQGLFEMGMDSLMSVELKGCIEVALGAELPSTLTFNYPNIAALADFLVAEFAGSSDVADTTGSGREPSAPDAVIPIANDLTEDELEALLTARLARLQDEPS